MTPSNKLEKHFSLTSSSDIEQICKPIFDLLDINYFTYHRVFEDGTVLRLSNYPEWTEQYIRQNYFDSIKLDYCPDLTKDSLYTLWNHYLDNDPGACFALQDCYVNFGIQHGFTMFKNQKTFTEQFMFAKRSPSKNFDDGAYLNHIEVIEKFSSYFVESASPLISQANGDRFKTSKSTLKSSSASENKDLVINVKGEEISLSPREIDCLSGVIKGYSAKTIGLDLKIAYRTVEKHISNLRRKLKLHSSQEIINYIRNFPPLFYYLIRRN